MEVDWPVEAASKLRRCSPSQVGGLFSAKSPNTAPNLFKVVVPEDLKVFGEGCRTPVDVYPDLQDSES